MHPHLFRIGSVVVPTFGVVAALGLVAAILVAARGARMVRVSEDAVWNLCIAIAGGTLILSRLIIVGQMPKAFLQYPLYILTLPTVTRYGLLTAMLSGLVYAWRKHLPLLRTADALAPAALLFQAFLHLGSLFAGDDLGSPARTWFGRFIPGDPGYHPVALYSAVLILAAAGAGSLWLSREAQAGETLGLCMTLAGLIRYFVDQLRPDYVLPGTMLAGTLRIDQVVLIVLSAAGLCCFFQRRPIDAQ